MNTVGEPGTWFQKHFIPMMFQITLPKLIITPTQQIPHLQNHCQSNFNM